ncbi:50S ribosomal protein L25 [Candidatus Saccharibacteria bacterium]|nr:50S ribosomal protein L25 [Candidatus Saccharibacteria bacterium]
MSHENVVLSVEHRDPAAASAKHLLQQGTVPGVVYDHGKTSHVQVNDFDLLKALRIVGRSQPLEIDVDGKKHLAMIKQVDRHPVRHTFRHVAFQAVRAGEKVTASVPIELQFDEGNDASPAERAGLIVLRAVEAVEVKAKATELPEALYVNGEKLVAAGDQLTLGDITLPRGVEFADHEADMGLTIASAYEPSAVAAANDAAGGEEDADAESVEAENGSDTAEEAKTETK